MIRHEGILTDMHNEVESTQWYWCSQQNILVPQ